MSLLEKLKKNSAVKHVEILEDSKFFDTELTYCGVEALNLAYSGDLDGGFGSGIINICGFSRNFKCCAPDTKLVVFKKI